jgi:hypothetical protein
MGNLGLGDAVNGINEEEEEMMMTARGDHDAIININNPPLGTPAAAAGDNVGRRYVLCSYVLPFTCFMMVSLSLSSIYFCVSACIL